MSFKPAKLKIYFSPKKMEFLAWSFEPTDEIERNNFFVIKKKDGSIFSKIDLKKINEVLADREKQFDFSPYIVTYVQSREIPLKYVDYYKQKFSLPVSIKAIQDETDKLLHYLYKEASQP